MDFWRLPARVERDSLPIFDVKVLERVRLAEPVRNGRTTLPAGSIGTVVFVYSGRRGLEVEFASPEHAVLTLHPGQIDLA